MTRVIFGNAGSGGGSVVGTGSAPLPSSGSMIPGSGQPTV
jgi:hypothetical protein